MPNPAHANARLAAVASHISSSSSSSSPSSLSRAKSSPPFESPTPRLAQIPGSGGSYGDAGEATNSMAATPQQQPQQQQQQQQHKEPITCHVLDTTTGTPAAGVRVTLQQLQLPDPSSSASASAANNGGLSSLAAAAAPLSVFVALTNEDGRVTRWTPASSSSSPATGPSSLAELLDGSSSSSSAATASGSSRAEEGGGGGEGEGEGKSKQRVWKLIFSTGQHFAKQGITPFFPEVEITFVTGGRGQEGRGHYHVPLLVGPFNYTTYRGS